MKITADSIEANIASGPDRMALANALFDLDMQSDQIQTAYFQLETAVGEVTGLTVCIMEMQRESGNQTKKWCFNGTIGPKTRQKTGFALAQTVSGYYDLSTRKGWIRFKRI